MSFFFLTNSRTPSNKPLYSSAASEVYKRKVLQQLEEMFDGTTVHRGDTHSYIGMLFDFSTPGKVHVKMDGYIDDFLTDYEVKGSAPTPAKGDLFELDLEAELPDAATKELFHSRVATCLYFQKRTSDEQVTRKLFSATEREGGLG